MQKEISRRKITCPPCRGTGFLSKSILGGSTSISGPGPCTTCGTTRIVWEVTYLCKCPTCRGSGSMVEISYVTSGGRTREKRRTFTCKPCNGHGTFTRTSYEKI